MVLRVLVALGLLLLAELAVLVAAGRLLGVWWTIGLLAVSGLAGAALARSQGLRTYRRFRRCLDAGVFPGAELVDGAFILAGGVLLLVPGLLTDAAAMILLIPASRRWVKRLAWWAALRHPIGHHALRRYPE